MISNFHYYTKYCEIVTQSGVRAGVRPESGTASGCQSQTQQRPDTSDQCLLVFPVR